MGKKKNQALEQLKESATARKEIQRQLNDLEKRDKDTRLALSRESCQELLEGFKALYDALAPGGSVNKLCGTVKESVTELAGYDTNYAKELLLLEPYGLKVADEGSIYMKGLLCGLLRPETEFYQILEKIITGRRTPGNPFHIDVKGVKDGKK